jgi:hypothetical protein
MRVLPPKLESFRVDDLEKFLLTTEGSAGIRTCRTDALKAA